MSIFTVPPVSDHAGLQKSARLDINFPCLPPEGAFFDKNSLGGKLNIPSKGVVCQEKIARYEGFVETSCEDRYKEISKWD
jgi:hypothetical protein